MTIGKNIAFNYLSQFYTALIGIFVLPWYLKIMGAEAYGLIGFFTLLQSIFALLDLGLTSTMTRQSARLSVNGVASAEYLGLFRMMRLFFFSIGTIGALALALNSGIVARLWLNNSVLSDEIVIHCLALISIVIGLRWVSGLYRGVVSGFERQVWLSNFNMIIASMRFILPLPLLILISPSPVVYFGFQIVIALFELLVLMIFVNKLIPRVAEYIKPRISTLKPHLLFALKISFLSAVWVLVTQIDKLVLSKTLSLTDYGYFSLGVMASSLILFVSGPIGTALLPRLTALYASNDTKPYYEMYSKYTRMVASLVFPAALLLFVFPIQILQLWISDSTIAARVAPVLSLYALGNAFLALSAFTYYLQYSVGNMRLHIYGNLIFLTVVVPAIAFASTKYGMLGAALVWVSVNVLYFLLWVPIVHRRFYPGKHIQWLISDCMRPFLLAATAPLLGCVVLSWNHGPVITMAQLALIGIISVAVTPYGKELFYLIKNGVQK